jgi:hypothetical protein
MKRQAAGAGCNPVPRCRRRNEAAKIQPVKGLGVEICDSKYYPTFDWLDSEAVERTSTSSGQTPVFNPC